MNDSKRIDFNVMTSFIRLFNSKKKINKLCFFVYFNHKIAIYFMYVSFFYKYFLNLCHG